MDKNQSIGLVLLMGLLLGWYYFTAPSAEEIEAQKRTQDSIRLAKEAEMTLSKDDEVAIKQIYTPASTQQAVANVQSSDSTQVAQPKQGLKEQKYSLKNDKMTVSFSNRGGRIDGVLLSKYSRIEEDAEHNEIKQPLMLLNDDRNVFEYILPIKGQGNISSEQILFNAEQSGNTITFTGDLGNGGQLVQKYTLRDDYTLAYDVNLNNANNVLADANTLELNWVNYLDKQEKNTEYEKMYSTVYFKPLDDNSDYCNCRSDDTEEVDDKKLKWVSNTNQFFNTSIIANNFPFEGGEFETVTQDKDAKSLKLLKSKMNIPVQGLESGASYTIYAGPNEFKDLRAFDVGLEEVVPFGRSIFGSINRWIIRPAFDFLSSFIGSKGIVIIVLIFIIKMLLYPLTYKMLHSQAKMGALKPKLAHLNKKYEDDPQKKQMETMSIYREYGVSPLGGCLPMVVQMPIWYALFRFFPASITFRQEPFLWATDLSSYDVIAHLPFTIPAFGDHISLFTVLWAITTVLYTYYNTKHVDMSANPAMKYVQYMMPLMFLVFFNNYASGLTCYMFFSNLFNILQTVLTKKFVFNDEKILAELEKKKETAKTKPKSGFQARLEEAMKQQQEIQKKRQQQQSKGKKKR